MKTSFVYFFVILSENIEKVNKKTFNENKIVLKN